MSATRRQGTDRNWQEQQSKGRTTVEWITLGISVMIIASLVGLITYLYVSGGSTPAVIEVKPQFDQIRQVQDRYYLPVEITNVGGETAEEVTVRISLASVNGQTEPAEVTIAFLAGHASANATVAFREDPSQGEVMVDVVSYLEP